MKLFSIVLPKIIVNIIMQSFGISDNTRLFFHYFIFLSSNYFNQWLNYLLSVNYTKT